MSASPSLRILHLEDNPSDRELAEAVLRADGLDCEIRWVDSEKAFVAALASERFDVVLADFNLPGFDAPHALDIVNRSGLDVPFIVLSGSVGEETAVKVLRNGAADYLLKDRMARLGQAIRRAVIESEAQREKREAEERMRFALAAAQVGTWEADLKADTCAWSEILEALHGLPPGTFSGSLRSFLDYIHPDDREECRETIERATRTRTDFAILYRTIWPDGTLHWVRGRGQTFYDEAGVPARAAGVGYDVTELRALEDQYRQAQKMEAVGQFAGGIAHDFNNLLTGIIGYSQLVLDAVQGNEALTPDLEEIKKAGERASGLTRQLLAFCRKQVLMPRVLDLNRIVVDLHKMLGRVIGEDVRLEIVTAPSLDHTKADPGQVEQVLMNLAVNARDAMPEGGQLRITTANAQLHPQFAKRHPGMVPGRYVSISVEDNGCGMTPEVMTRVFEPFFTTKGPTHGTGLGLATVYGIVKQSGGYITVDSKVGRGTTFTVYLPAVDEEVEASVTRKATATLAGTETVLLVEDDVPLRTLMVRMLKRQGYAVLEAESPAHALAIAKQAPRPIHLLLTDIVMPDMNGPTLIQQLMPFCPDMKVLCVSGFPASAADNAVFRNKRVSFLPKPFTPSVLVKAVRERLDR